MTDVTVGAAAPTPVMPEGFLPCTPGSQELVPDYKGLLSLPFDTETEGAKCVRFVLFAKGSVVHVPAATGRYVTTKPYEVVNLPMMVHFTGLRKPEVCVTVCDFGATNGELSGVSIESLALPLKKSNNKYNTQLNMTLVDQVIGFTPLAAGDATINISNTLKGISPFKQFAASTANGILNLIARPLHERIQKLKEHGMARIKLAVDAIAKSGDHTAAAQQQGLFAARLEKMVGAIQSFPPTSYDVRLRDRITVIEADTLGKVTEDLGHDWLSSPLKKALVDGAGARVLRSRFCEMPPQQFPIATLPTSPIRSAAAAGLAQLAATFLERSGGSPAARAPAAPPSPQVLVDDEKSDNSSDESSIDGGILEASPVPIPPGSKRDRAAVVPFNCAAGETKAAGKRQICPPQEDACNWRFAQPAHRSAVHTRAVRKWSEHQKANKASREA